MLSLCVECNRHVRGPACPFCGAPVAARPKAPGARASRTAKLLGAAALGVACGGTVGSSDGGTDAASDVAFQPPYGAVIPDGGFDAGAPTDAATAADGAADPDAADADDADASNVALYGAPPPPAGE